MSKSLAIVVAAALLFVSASVFAQGKGNSKPPPLQPLAWYDANGQFVGRANSMGIQQVAMPWGLDNAWVTVTQDGPSRTDVWFAPHGSVLFSDGLCTGSMHILGYAVLGTSRMTATIIDQETGALMLYVSSAYAPPLIVNYQSYRDSYGWCNGVAGQAPDAAPVEGILNLSQQFARPLVLK